MLSHLIAGGATLQHANLATATSADPCESSLLGLSSVSDKQVFQSLHLLTGNFVSNPKAQKTRIIRLERPRVN